MLRVNWGLSPHFSHGSVDISLYFLCPDDYSIFDTPDDDTARAVALLVPLRTGFTFGVRACADARLLFSNLHVRTDLIGREVLEIVNRKISGSCGKVMFSHVSVIPFTGEHARGHVCGAWVHGVCMCLETCMHAYGVYMHRRYTCGGRARAHGRGMLAWWGPCMKNASRWYASYWNTFLFSCARTITQLN